MPNRFSSYQLIGVFKAINQQPIEELKAQHFWDDVVVLAEQHGFMVSGGVRELPASLKQLNDFIENNFDDQSGSF